MPKSREYWRKRFEILASAQAQIGAEYFEELSRQYAQASAAVQADIEKWYARFAVNNDITMQEARKLLTSDELEELKWNVMEYIKYGRENDVTKQWMKQLENASAKWHISRLEAIKLQIQHHAEVLYGRENEDFKKIMAHVYEEGYYHTAYEITKGYNLGYSLMKLDTDKIEKVLTKPWAADGSNFSDRIWRHKTQLVSELHNGLTQSIIRGKNPYEVTQDIAKRFNVSRKQAGRLVMTESAFIASSSTYDSLKELGVEQYEIDATLDKSTSEICRAMDKKVFPMSQFEIGVTAPPFHPWCRTDVLPYFDDEFELGSKRIARGDDDKTYYVPADMNYNDWYKQYVGVKTDSEGLRSLLGSSNMSVSEIDKLKSFDDLKRYLKDNYNAKVDEDVLSLNFESVRQMTKEFEEVMLEFDWSRSSFTGLNKFDLGYASFSPGGELCFNPQFSTVFNKITLTSGYHEAGHLLELALIKKTYPYMDIDGIKNKLISSEMAEDIVNKAFSRIRSNKSILELRKEISNQATKNYSETLAEAIRDYKLNGYSGATLTVQIIKVLKEIK
ncbi:MAG: hypothetical protein E7284_10175 [Lachnospiraceae bacterium]|nr:hypothetical protein [Lachnospiraceae bacterium]